jgi:hypothetical protein
MTSGIYAITNTHTDERYIGASKNSAPRRTLKHVGSHTVLP